MNSNLRLIPSVSKLIEQDKGKVLISSYGRKDFLEHCRAQLDYIRKNMDEYKGDIEISTILEEIEERLHSKSRKNLTKVINCTGTILHTNLGRAPLPQQVIEKVAQLGPYYNNLEFDLESGERGSRTSGVSEQLSTILGTEDCVIVNNNAAAVLLTLMAITKNKEVIISRGQLVEIGGSFRVPEIMEQSGSILKEVGTTNKVHLKDYDNAINENTGAILRVHPSNYRVVGFTEEVDLNTLSQLAHQKGLPLIDDLGSGTFISLKKWGIHDEPTVKESLDQGADIVTFSGDKLLGGPQCGIIVGKKEYLAKIKKHPLMRALRCDKLVLSALQGTLEIYKRGDLENIPLYHFLNRDLKDLHSIAEKVTKGISKEKYEIIEDYAYVGGGSLPNHKIPTVAIKIKSETSCQKLSSWFRQLETPIIGRISQGEFLLDLKAMFEQDTQQLHEALTKI